MKPIMFTKVIQSALLTKSYMNGNELDNFATDLLGPIGQFVKLARIDSYFDVTCRGMERLEFQFIVIKEHEKRFNLLKAFI